MRSSLFGLVLGAVTALGVTSATAETSAWSFAGVKFANPIDSSTWYEAANEVDMAMHEPITINVVDPDFWMSLIKPESHSVMHHAFLNPTNWKQFAEVDTYTAMMDPQIWMKWAQPSTYAVFADPQTYVYRMQPGAFTHIMSADAYSQLANPSAYMDIMTTAMDTMGMTAMVKAGSEAIGPIME